MLVALAFCLSTFERWLGRSAGGAGSGALPGRRPHELAWTISLAMFVLGAATLLLGAANGWDGPTFRGFYLFGAILNVPFLAVGTVYLLGGRRAGDWAAAVVALVSAFAIGVLVEAPIHGSIVPTELPKGSDVFGALPRVLAAVASGAGAIVVLAGAVWSAWRLRETARRMVGANLLIAAGTVVLGVGGVLNSALGEMEAFAVSLLAGIALIFAGFLFATTRPPAPPRSDPNPDLTSEPAAP